MDTITVRRDERDAARRPRRVRPLVTVAAGIAALGLLVGGCGGDDDGGKGVAAANPGKGQNAQGGPGGGGGGDPLAYSKCMRENGLPDFPDPDAQGGLAIDGKKVDMRSAAYKAAEQKCKKFDAAPLPEPPADRQAAVKYAKCMRENGVPKFPDPNPDGGTNIDAGTIGVDIDGPVYKKADDTCKKNLVRGGKPREESG